MKEATAAETFFFGANQQTWQSSPSCCQTTTPFLLTGDDSRPMDRRCQSHPYTKANNIVLVIGSIAVRVISSLIFWRTEQREERSHFWGRSMALMRSNLPRYRAPGFSPSYESSCGQAELYESLLLYLVKISSSCFLQRNQRAHKGMLAHQISELGFDCGVVERAGNQLKFSSPSRFNCTSRLEFFHLLLLWGVVSE